MKRYLGWLLRLIGPALLIFFLWNSDLGKIWQSLQTLNWTPLLLSLALMLPFIIVKAWRWRVLMGELGLTPPTLREAATLYTIGLYYGGITPGQSGDFIKGWYLKRRGLALPPVLLSIVLDRLFDFVIMGAFAALALVAFADLLPQSAQIATIVFAVLVFCATPALMARGPREWFFARVLPLLPARAHAVVARWRDQFAQLALRPGPLASVIVATLLSAGSTMLRIWLLYLALGLGDIPLLEIFASTALIAILQALPISFAGIGVRDLVLVAVLARHGHSPELAITLSSLFLLLNIEQIIVGFLVSLRHPLPAEARQDAEAA